MYNHSSLDATIAWSLSMHGLLHYVLHYHLNVMHLSSILMVVCCVQWHKIVAAVAEYHTKSLNMALMMPACSTGGGYGGLNNFNRDSRRSRSSSLAVNSLHGVSGRRRSSLTPELHQFIYHQQQSGGRKSIASSLGIHPTEEVEKPRTKKEQARLLSEVLNIDFDPINLRTLTVEETFRKMEVSQIVRSAGDYWLQCFLDYGIYAYVTCITIIQIMQILVNIVDSAAVLSKCWDHPGTKCGRLSEK